MPEKFEKQNQEENNEIKKPDVSREYIKGILKEDEELLAQERVAHAQKNIPENKEELRKLRNDIFFSFNVRTSNAIKCFRIWNVWQKRRGKSY